MVENVMVLMPVSATVNLRRPPTFIMVNPCGSPFTTDTIAAEVFSPCWIPPFARAVWNDGIFTTSSELTTEA